MYNNKITKISLALITALAISSNAHADDKSEIKSLIERIAVLEETQQILIDETSDLKTGFDYTTVDTKKSHSGLGSAASKVYYSNSPLSIGGYGEMFYAYTNNDNAANTSKVDVYRFVPYIGYKFTDDIVLNVEIEFEHGGVKEDADGDGYVIVEFMYLDFLFNNNANIRVGNMLLPMGLINEKHEPTLFNTVQRPNTSKNLIPSTWHESGLMVYGEISEGLSYKLGGYTALDLELGAGSRDKWLRNSRIGSFGNTERGDDEDNLGLAVVGRVDYTAVNGLLLGASSYLDSNLNMYDLHVDYKKDAFRSYGVYTQTSRSKTVINEPEKAKGGFVNIGYDILSFTNSNDRMPLFVQYESVAAQDKVTNGVSVDAIETTTVGINYFPHEQVVLKMDHAMYDTKSITSLSMGFIF